MNLIKSTSLIKSNDIWTHDTIVHDRVIGRINEPLLITTCDGESFVPATIVYIQTPEGKRQFRNRRYERKLYDYVRDAELLTKTELKKYLLTDPISQSLMIGIPLEGSEIIRADESFNNICKSKSTFSEVLNSFKKMFPVYDFGVIGSVQLGLNGEKSDIDLFVYGGNDFFDLQKRLAKREIRKKLSITFQSNSRIEKHALEYKARYNIKHSFARKLARMRARYLVSLTNGKKIKLGLNGCSTRGSHSGLTILGSKIIKTVVVSGKIIEIVDSCSYPRKYVLQSRDEKFTVVSHHWSHQLLAKRGDNVTVRGNMRKVFNGESVIFLEAETDLIYPILKLPNP